MIKQRFEVINTMVEKSKTKESLMFARRKLEELRNNLLINNPTSVQKNIINKEYKKSLRIFKNRLKVLSS